MLLGLTNRLVPKFSKNSNKKLIKINNKANEFRKGTLNEILESNFLALAISCWIGSVLTSTLAEKNH